MDEYGPPKVAHAVDDYIPHLEDEANAVPLVVGERLLCWPDETSWWWARKEDGNEGYVPGTLVVVVAWDPVVALPVTPSTRHLPQAEIVEPALTRPPSAPPLEEEEDLPTTPRGRRFLPRRIFGSKNDELAALRARNAALEHEKCRLQQQLLDATSELLLRPPSPPSFHPTDLPFHDDDDDLLGGHPPSGSCSSTRRRRDVGGADSHTTTKIIHV